MVLARLPDAPPGTRGLSLFLVPSRRLQGGAPGLKPAMIVDHADVRRMLPEALTLERRVLVGAACLDSLDSATLTAVE